MTTLDFMATHAEQSPMERLQAMVDAQAGQALEWRTKLPILRAQSAATSVMLGELARTPSIAPRPDRDYADVVIAAHTREWAESVADRLRSALPSGHVDLGAPGEGLGDSRPLTGYTVRCQVWLPGARGAKATAQVRSVLAKMDDLVIDYSVSLDLLAVSPSG
jgi:hypothetical protein